VVLLCGRKVCYFLPDLLIFLSHSFLLDPDFISLSFFFLLLLSSQIPSLSGRNVDAVVQFGGNCNVWIANPEELVMGRDPNAEVWLSHWMDLRGKGSK